MNQDLKLAAESWYKLIIFLQPKCIIELGTGAGHTAAKIMSVLPAASHFYTINWPNPPSGDPVGIELLPWANDKRLKQILGDTREVSEQIPNGIDLLFIDSGTEHINALISAEWKLYAPKLVDGAIVICDDLTHNDMMDFWNSLPYEKTFIWNNLAGLFIYAK